MIERIAFAARDDKKIDKRSGVSQRLPISAIENVVSNAERRALTHQEKFVVPRISDIYAALPAITGKLELEYEGEMKGADHVSRELIRTAIAKTFDAYLHGVNLSQVVQWFDLGGEIQLSDNAAAEEVLDRPEPDSGTDGKTRQAERRPERQRRDAGVGGGVRPGRPARAQENRTQRGARVYGGREANQGRGEASV